MRVLVISWVGFCVAAFAFFIFIVWGVMPRLRAERKAHYAELMERPYSALSSDDKYFLRIYQEYADEK